MKLLDIIKTNSWLSIEPVFLKLFPDEKDLMSEYEKMYCDLLLLTPIDDGITVVVSPEIDDYDQAEYVHVYGYYNDPKRSENEITNGLALEFTQWEKWMAMDIDIKSYKKFTEPELISHCIHEMSYFSFDQEEIQEEIEKLTGMVDEIKNMTDEEKKKHLTPWEDIKKKLDEEKN